MGIVVYSFIATGKTELCKRYSNVIELSSELYHWLDCSYDECSKECNKGNYKVMNPQWPYNYYLAIKEYYLNTNKIILITHSGSVGCELLNIPYILVYPTKNQKKEYINRLRIRQNSDEFIKNMENNFNDYIDCCCKNKYAKKHIVLEDGMFLEDVYLKGDLIYEDTTNR